MAPNNALPIWGNEKTMNLNSMILTNVQSSPYFKVNLFGLKTYHEVIDEIYYKVNHLEPWEKGSRKTAGQTGMCGGVRGVGAGGIVSTCFCILYKLYTLKLTRKQVNGLMTHTDSPYIRALGFMYIRYTQPPADLWEWFEPYLSDDEEVDVKAGGGHVMSIGEMLRQWLTKLEWYATLFPRIPVPVQKQIDQKLREWEAQNLPAAPPVVAQGVRPGGRHIPDEEVHFGEAERMAESDRRRPGGARPSPPFDIAKAFDRDNSSHSRDKDRDKERRSKSRDKQRRRSRSRSRDRKKKRSRSRERQKPRDHHRSRSRDRQRSRERHRSRDRDRDRDRERDRHNKKHRSRSRERKRSRSRDRRRSRSRDKRRSRSRDKKQSRSADRKADRENSFERDLKRELKRHNKEQNGS